MGMKLDGKTVAPLEPPDADGKVKDRIVFDTEIRQFGVRVRKDSEGVTRRAWIVRYKIGTAQFRPKLGDFPTVSAEQARKAAKDLLAKVQLVGRRSAGGEEVLSGNLRSRSRNRQVAETARSRIHRLRLPRWRNARFLP